MQKKDNSKPSMDKNERKRGRPSGKNRVPLSLAERRARNAQYERERRNETADAMAQLAEAASCDPQITNPELLATVINRLQQTNSSSESINDLRQINEDLESQIADLLSRLESDPDLKGKDLDELSDGQTSTLSEGPTSTSGSGSDARSSANHRPSKYRKTSKMSRVNDEVRLSSSSHPESSTDSQDSVWSNHHLGKTLPSHSLEEMQSTQNIITFESEMSTHLDKAGSISSESDAITIQNRLNFEDEFYSEFSEQSDALAEKSSQQDVKIEIKLFPELSEMLPESIEEQSDINFMDPFTDGEKAILESLGCSDFINFQDVYSDNQDNLRWPVDFTGY